MTIWVIALSNSLKLWALPCRATQDGPVMLENSDKTWLTGEQNGKFIQFSSIAQLCPTLCDPMNCSKPGLPVHQLSELPQTLLSIELVMPSNHLILCHSLLLLSSVFPSIRDFSKESALQVRWPKYWSFSFNISPSSEYSGLISFRMDWLDLLAVQGTQESSSTPQFKNISSLALSFLYGPSHIHTWLLEKP